MASRVFKKVIRGRLVIARPRRTEIEVDVYSGDEEDPGEQFPELPWDAREAHRGASPTKQYTTMNDGDPKAHTVPPGSIVLERRLRRI